MALPAQVQLLLTLLAVTCLYQASYTQTISFVFNGFDGKNISLSGIAEADGGLIKLTNISSHQFGRAFYPYPIHIKNRSTNVVSSFSTTFVFCISTFNVPPILGGHGMAFVMSPSLDSRGISASQFLGMLRVSNEGNASNHVFGVEFDTIQDVDVADINDNHVGINLNSMISIHSTEAGYWPPSQNASQKSTSKTVINLKSGVEIQGWIEYNGHSQQLNVSIVPVGQPKPDIPLLSVSLDLSGVVLEHMFVGFSAATGILTSTQRLLSWSFNSNGEARSLDLSMLPLIAPKPPLLASTHFKVAIFIATIVSVLLIGSSVGLLLYKRSQREVMESWELEFGLHRYSYKEIRKATRNFHDTELLGVGGFGRVFKGVFPNGLEVAVKRLSRESAQGEREFIAEIASTGRLRHRNLVQLFGWSRHDGQLFLVYDFMPNGSLDKMLFGKTVKVLRWEQRQKIIKGIAAGMLYLHEGWEQQVLHRDVKASNVLLDAEMNGRLGDFGLARLYEHGQNPHTTRVVGTFGYLAPEFAMTGKATTSTDVYSFGALLLEVVTGRRPLEQRAGGGAEEPMNVLLVEWVWELQRRGRLREAVDGRLDGLYHAQEVERVLMLGLHCSHPDPSARPTMRQVVQILENEAPLPPIIPSFHQAYQQHLSRQHIDLISQYDGDLLSFSSFSIKPSNTLDAITDISGR